MNKNNHKLTTWQLTLISVGSIIGAVWLFSPYYGFQTAGIGVIASWLIVAVFTLIIGLSFAEIVSSIPISGGLLRLISVTHNDTISFVFLLLGWLSYVVILPLEAQSIIQYLSFWYKDLVVSANGSATLSHMGLMLSVIMIMLLTWFNTSFLSNVARVNSIVSIAKILVPIAIAWTLILIFGSWENVKIANINHKFSFENVLLAIAGSGIAFAFTGFQNGLILANTAKNIKKAIPYSLFIPIIISAAIYCSVSLIYIACLGNKQMISGAAAPLLAILTLFGVHTLITVLFVDAVVSPLGTANVFTTATARILYGLAQNFFPKSLLTKVNKKLSPIYCLWFNALIGICFLLPFPTWQQLVDFLSSIVIFSYLSGPITLMALREELPDLNRPFKLPYYKLIGYLGFICCTLLIYWSSFNNLVYLTGLVLVTMVGYNLFIQKKAVHNLLISLKSNFFILIYLLCMVLIKHLHQIKLISFPIDNLIIAILAIFSCKILVANRISKAEIKNNLTKFSTENIF